MSRLSIANFILLIIGVPMAVAQPSTGPSLTERLATIKKEEEAAEKAFYKAIDAIVDTPAGRKEQEELAQAYDKGQAARFMAALDLAKSDPKSHAALDALEWILTIPRAYYLPAGKPAMELATAHHAANPKIGKTIAWVGRFRPRQGDAQDAALALIKAVAVKNPDKTARGQAVLAIAWQAHEKFAVAEYKKSPDVERLAAEAEKAFEIVLKDFGDCQRLGMDGLGTLGDRAKAELFELRHLRIGKVAPEIQGEDLDGVKFKLSDYRGKVIVLSFWGDW